MSNYIDLDEITKKVNESHRNYGCQFVPGDTLAVGDNLWAKPLGSLGMEFTFTTYNMVGDEAEVGNIMLSAEQAAELANHILAQIEKAG